MDPFKWIELFEQDLAEYTGAPYVIATDCCTHAIELAMRYDQVKQCEFSAHTYLSVLMLFHHLRIKYKLTGEQWSSKYHFKNTRIWDCARLLSPNMYIPGEIQCVSFGRGKPLEIGRGGALLLDDKDAYTTIVKQRYDGRDLNVLPWVKQKTFKLGWHYKLIPDEAQIGRQKLALDEINTNQPGWEFYPDTRDIIIEDNLNE